jgi:hypothetical protein
MVNPAKQIILNFVPTQVVGEVAMQLSYTNIPEGWGFVHQALCDALKQVGQLWAQSQRAVIVPPNGVRH